MPWRCGACLGHPEARATYRTPFTGERLPGVPLCKACRRTHRWKWVKLITALVLGPCILAAAGMFACYRAGASEWTLLIPVLALVLLIVSLAVAHRRLLWPYRARMIDGRRSVARLIFSNAEYARLARDAYASRSVTRS